MDLQKLLFFLFVKIILVTPKSYRIKINSGSKFQKKNYVT